MPSATRTFIAPNSLFGWDPDKHVVEVQRISKRGDIRAVDAVYVNGKHIGHVVGRTSGRRREWDCLVGTATPTTTDFVRFVYPTTERQHALTALVERISRTS